MSLVLLIFVFDTMSSLRIYTMIQKKRFRSQINLYTFKARDGKILGFVLFYDHRESVSDFVNIIGIKHSKRYQVYVRETM